MQCCVFRLLGYLYSRTFSRNSIIFHMHLVTAISSDYTLEYSALQVTQLCSVFLYFIESYISRTKARHIIKGNIPLDAGLNGRRLYVGIYRPLVYKLYFCTFKLSLLFQNFFIHSFISLTSILFVNIVFLQSIFHTLLFKLEL